MKATVVAVIDGTVTEETHTADRITCKIHRDGRAYITLDNDTVIYRRAERIQLERGDRPNALTPRGGVTP